VISRHHYILWNDDGAKVATLIIDHPIVVNQTLTLIRTTAPRGRASSYIDLPGVYLVIKAAHRLLYGNGYEAPTKLKVLKLMDIPPFVSEEALYKYVEAWDDMSL
jgi:hypothetical protein